MYTAKSCILAFHSEQNLKFIHIVEAVANKDEKRI